MKANIDEHHCVIAKPKGVFVSRALFRMLCFTSKFPNKRDAELGELKSPTCLFDPVLTPRNVHDPMSSLLRCTFPPKRYSSAIGRLTHNINMRGGMKTVGVASSSTSLCSETRENAAERSTINPRISPLGIQMIPKSLHRQIFSDEPLVSEDAIEKSKRHLKSHGIDITSDLAKPLRDVDINLPPLSGSDSNEHFVQIANQQTESYLLLATSLANASLPQMPKKWCFSAGWTKYDGNQSTVVPYPDEDGLILDVEVCVRDSERPVLATAVSSTHWYSWVSERLLAHEDYDVGAQGRRTTPRDLIPLESDPDHSEPLGGKWRERLVVGHNVSYDRARIKEQYLMKVRASIVGV